MDLAKVLFYPDQKLQQTAEEVTSFDKSTKELTEVLLHTMREYDGIGLAAPQIGVLQRIFVMEIEKNARVFVNPVIQSAEGEASINEGCLSFPNLRAYVKRKASLKLSYQTIEGEKKEMLASDLSAICIQHEIDHLDGILFIDRVSPFQRKLLLAKYKNAQN